MSGQLAEAVRTVIATLRSLANTLESALARAEVTNSVPPVLDLESAHSWEFPASAAPEPAPVQFSTPRNGSAPALTASSPARTSYSTNSYHEVADSLPGLPGYCLDWCIRLGGSKEEITARASRAWFAGCWARAAADGRVPKPRPTPTSHRLRHPSGPWTGSTRQSWYCSRVFQVVAILQEREQRLKLHLSFLPIVG